MSQQVPTAFVTAFRDSVTHLSQQKGSRFRPFVDIDTGIVGTRASYDQIGVVPAPSPALSRHKPSPQSDTPHNRRWLSLADFDHGDFVDKFDRIKMLFDPTAKYVEGFKMTFGRAIDDIIIAAATGTSYTGADGTSTTALSSWNSSRQLIAVDYVPVGAAANSGLTIGKLIAAKSAFGKNDVDADEPLFIAVRQQQLDDLLTTDEIRSSDYNTVRALVKGDIDTYLGFTFIRTQRLAHSTSTDYTTCFAWAKSGLKLGFGLDEEYRVAERPDMSFAMYAYGRMSLGATRMEEAKVVQILCDESP